MQKHLKLPILIMIAVLTGGCSWFSGDGFEMVSFPGVYKIDIQQGNVITQDMVNQLKPGMSPGQVAYILGMPLLPDSFNKDRWDYIYTLQPGGKSRTRQILSVFFKDGKLARFKGNFRPGPSQGTSDHAQGDVRSAAEPPTEGQAGK